MKKDGIKIIHLLLLLVVIAVFIWSAIKPASYLTWMLEVSPAVVGLIIVILAISMFIGGHYVYSKVPLFDWIKEVCNLERNHYDRFGHLLKGLFVIVLREILLRKTPLTKGPWLFTIVISMSLAIAALYEIIEWLASKIAKGGKAIKDFLGTQGDIWDTQWDMLCCLVGSIVALLIFSKLHDRLLKKEVIKE
jgi:putative membrane protein